MTCTPHRQVDRRRGSAMVEFALSMLVLAPIAYGIVHYGYGLFLLNEIGIAARAGARYASIRPMEGAKIDEFKSAVKNMTACGNPGNCIPGQSLAPGLTPERVTVEVTFERNVPAMVCVRLSPPATRSIGLPPGKPEMSLPYLGQWTP